MIVFPSGNFTVFASAVYCRTNCDIREMSCGFPTANLSLVSHNQEVSVLKLFLLEVFR